MDDLELRVSCVVASERLRKEQMAEMKAEMERQKSEQMAMISKGQQQNGGQKGDKGGGNGSRRNLQS